MMAICALAKPDHLFIAILLVLVRISNSAGIAYCAALSGTVIAILYLLDPFAEHRRL
jgi:hypothetical protein